ncbi:MAG: 30S ribosomal protein S15 [Legionellaceae bacterium]|nr:30S ribosomal protein S15 [Legionellaceae bacterium]
MTLTSVQTAEIVNNYKQSENDTGSSEVQVSLMTSRIKYLTEHFKQHKKDFHSRRGLQALVNRRRKLLKYLKKENIERYSSLIKSLGLRDSY